MSPFARLPCPVLTSRSAIRPDAAITHNPTTRTLANRINYNARSSYRHADSRNFRPRTNICIGLRDSIRYLVQEPRVCRVREKYVFVCKYTRVSFYWRISRGLRVRLCGDETPETSAERVNLANVVENDRRMFARSRRD